MTFRKVITTTKVDYNELEDKITEHFPGVEPDLMRVKSGLTIRNIVSQLTAS